MEKTQTEEIDLIEIFYALKRRLLLILAAGLLCGCLSCIYAKVFITPTYTSTSSILVLSKETTLTSIADLQLGTQLTKDYQVLIKSTSVVEKVIQNLGLDMSVAALKNCISISNPADTRVLYLSVTHSDAALAAAIVNELSNVASDYVGDKMEVIPPKVIEVGEIPTSKTAPNVTRYAFMGLLLGIVVCCGIIALIVIMDDTIKSEDDIARYLELPTLATVPDRKDYIGDQKNGKKLKAAQNKKLSQKGVPPQKNSIPQKSGMPQSNHGPQNGSAQQKGDASWNKK